VNSALASNNRTTILTLATTLDNNNADAACELNCKEEAALEGHVRLCAWRSPRQVAVQSRERAWASSGRALQPVG
jgi:hypothetical protein